MSLPFAYQFELTVPLTEADLQKFAVLRISPDLLELAGVRRVTHEQAESFGINWSGDRTGIIFPCVIDGRYLTCRVRRDFPEVINGEVENKYLCPYGDRRHVYVAPGYQELLADPSVSFLFVESEKAVLTITSWSKRTGHRLLPIGVGGCYGWSATTGIRVTSNGSRVPEKGVLPEIVAWARAGRRCGILFDRNAATNLDVQNARARFQEKLIRQGALVRIVSLPAEGKENGPDDFLSAHGDEAFFSLLNQEPSKQSYVLTKKGDIKPLLANAILALREAAEFRGVLAFNEFSLYVVTKKPTPWQMVGGSDWSDADDSLAADFLQHRGVHVTSKLVGEAVQVLAHENPFHPVRDYLNGLTWDGVPRIDKWLITYIGAEEDLFTLAIGPRWLISAIARIMEPPCRVDHTLILEGPQGIQKSTALETLAGEGWFRTNFPPLITKIPNSSYTGDGSSSWLN